DAHRTAPPGMRFLLLPRLHFLRSGGPCGGRLRKRAVLELLLTLAVLTYRVAAAVKLEFIRRQTLEPHGPAGVELAGADAQLGAKTVTEAVRETRRRVLIHTGGI